MSAKLKDMRERLKEAFGDEALGKVIAERNARKEEKVAEALLAASLADGDDDETSDEQVAVHDGQGNDGETDDGDSEQTRFSVRRIRAACIAFCEATERNGLAAFMRAIWDNNATILPYEADMLEEIVPRLLDGELERTVCRAIVKGSF
jgi:hypothetical protein